MVAHPWSASGGLCLILKFWLDRSYSFGESAILIYWHFGSKLPFHAHFYGILGAHFPQMTSSIVVTPKKALPCAETRRLSYKAWKSVQWFDLGARQKKRTEQENTIKKLQRRYFSGTLEETPTKTTGSKICVYASCLLFFCLCRRLSVLLGSNTSVRIYNRNNCFR